MSEVITTNCSSELREEFIKNLTPLQQLVEKCHTFSIEVNEHKSYYQSIQDYLVESTNATGRIDIDSLSEDLCREIQERDRIVLLQVYPTTPVGFFTVCHYDVEEAIKIALVELNKP